MRNTQLDHAVHRPSGKKYPLSLLAHDIDGPMNVGGLFRIADALGVEKIYLTGQSAVPPNPKIRKTSRSAEKHVSYHYEKDAMSVVKELTDSGYRIVSLEITNHSIDLKDLEVGKDEKICLVLGSENTGINQDLLDASNAVVHIPMLGANSSMNVATACAIAAYVLTRKMDAARTTAAEPGSVRATPGVMPGKPVSSVTS